MQPAEARNYFSASYFSRDILIPSLFSSVLLIEISIIFPLAREVIYEHVAAANAYLFIMYVFLFFAASVSSTALFFRAFTIFNKSILRHIIKYTDYDIYYKRNSNEISKILQELSTPPDSILDECIFDFSDLETRDQVNILLRLAERIFPEGSLLLARHYAFLAATYSLLVAQFILLTVSIQLGSSFGVFISCGAVGFLTIAIVGIVRAAASSEFDVLRACIVLNRMEDMSQKPVRINSVNTS